MIKIAGRMLKFKPIIKKLIVMNHTHNMNNNQKNNILMSQNIRFWVDNNDKYMHRNIPEWLVFFSDVFRH